MYKYFGTLRKGVLRMYRFNVETGEIEYVEKVKRTNEKTKIEWCDSTLNPVVGCTMDKK